MKKQIKRMSPHQNAKVIGVLMGLGALVFAIPMSLIMLMIPMPPDQNGHHMGAPAFIFLLLPVFYLVFGYIMVAIWCALYNFVTQYIGGIEFEVDGENE